MRLAKPLHQSMRLLRRLNSREAVARAFFESAARIGAKKTAAAMQSPSFAGLLAATIVQAMMGADGVSADDVRAVMREGSKHDLDGLLEKQVRRQEPTG